MTSSRAAQFWNEVERSADVSAQAREKLTAWIADATPSEAEELLAGVASHAAAHSKDEPSAALLNRVLGQLVRWMQLPDASGKRRLTPEMRERIALAYNELRESPVERQWLLNLLTASRTNDDLQLLAQLLATDPPATAEATGAALAALFQQRDYDPAALFPQLLKALAHPAVTAAVLDLANFLMRNERVTVHPAKERVGELAALLGTLAQRLGALEEQPVANEAEGQKIAATIAESVALAVCLCDALALMGDASVTGKLHQVLALRHRRLRTEAAAALARLGDNAGGEALVELAREPVARLRVLAYAKELGITEKIEEQYRTPEAAAEAELVSWLAEPTQFGLPPQECELFHAREQFWPGFDEPVECFLFRYTYRLGGGSFSNLGIAGPLAHTFRADLGNLPPDDIYAAFAGWQAEHEEIFELDVARANALERVEVRRLERRLHDAGYTDIEPLTLGYFFGQRALVAQAKKDDVSGLAVADLDEIHFYAAANTRRPLGATEAYCIYKGRKLLRTFNQEE